MPFYENGDIRIHYEEFGNPDGYPLLLLAPGGPNSSIDFWSRMAFDPREQFTEFRMIGMDQRNAAGGESTGPIPTEKPWDAFAADQIGLLDHLGIREAFVLGFCIGGSFILKLMEVAPERVTAGVLCQPIGHRPEDPDVMWDANMQWGKDLVDRFPHLSLEDAEKQSVAQYRNPADFVYSVSRDFIRSCQSQMLVLPGIDRAHPYDVGVEVADLAPNSERIDPWKEPKELIPQAIEGIRDYLLRHVPVAAK
jgi:pimeloyl-ACP methyl ester carboxylesterase